MSLWDSILAYSLTSVLSKEMGLKFEGVVGSLPGLGIVTTQALSISEGNEAEDIASPQTDCNVGDRMFKKVLQYSFVNPSGPGDLPDGRVFIAFLISGSLMGALSEVNCAYEREGRLMLDKKVCYPLQAAGCWDQLQDCRASCNIQRMSLLYPLG